MWGRGLVASARATGGGEAACRRAWVWRAARSEERGAQAPAAAVGGGAGPPLAGRAARGMWGKNRQAKSVCSGGFAPATMSGRRRGQRSD